MQQEPQLPSGVEVRRGNRDDAASVADLWKMNAEEHASYDEIYTPVPNAREMMRQFLSEVARGEQNCFLVATADDPSNDTSTVVGFVTCELRSSTPTFVARTWATIEDVFVHPDWRSRGLGTALVRHCSDWASEMGASGLSLQVAARNGRGREFYARLGFREVSVYQAREL